MFLYRQVLSQVGTFPTRYLPWYLLGYLTGYLSLVLLTQPSSQRIVDEAEKERQLGMPRYLPSRRVPSYLAFFLVVCTYLDRYLLSQLPFQLATCLALFHPTEIPSYLATFSAGIPHRTLHSTPVQGINPFLPEVFPSLAQNTLSLSLHRFLYLSRRKLGKARAQKRKVAKSKGTFSFCKCRGLNVKFQFGSFFFFGNGNLQLTKLLAQQTTAGRGRGTAPPPTSLLATVGKLRNFRHLCWSLIWPSLRNSFAFCTCCCCCPNRHF